MRMLNQRVIVFSTNWVYKHGNVLINETEYKPVNTEINDMTTTTLKINFMLQLDKVQINGGGPVKSMAWCPTRLTDTTDQYLAVYAYSSTKTKHKMNQLYKYESVLQIWNCGTLENQYVSDLFPFFGSYGTNANGPM